MLQVPLKNERQLCGHTENVTIKNMFPPRWTLQFDYSVANSDVRRDAGGIRCPIRDNYGRGPCRVEALAPEPPNIQNSYVCQKIVQMIREQRSKPRKNSWMDINSC